MRIAKRSILQVDMESCRQVDVVEETVVEAVEDVGDVVESVIVVEVLVECCFRCQIIRLTYGSYG